MPGRFALLGLIGLLGGAACSEGRASPAPAHKPAAAPVIRPTVEPIRDELPTAEVAVPVAEVADEPDEHEMPAEVIARSPAPARAVADEPPKAPAKVELNDDDDAETDEPILSDALLGDITAPAKAAPPEPAAPAVAPKAAPIATPAKSVVSLGGTSALTESSLSPATVRKAVGDRYLADIRSCHRDHMREHPGAGGDVTLQITVGTDGRVNVARALGFAAELDACIKRQAKGWRFEVPTAAGEPVEAPFKLHLWLRAG